MCRGAPRCGRPKCGAAGTDFRDHATPTAFRNFLAAPTAVWRRAFPEDQSGALLGTTNATIFVVGTLASVLQYSNTLTILAVYEIDFVPTVEPAGGTVASVRRYSGTDRTVPTDYYHVYYPGRGQW